MTTAAETSELLTAIRDLKNGKQRITAFRWLLNVVPIMLVVLGASVTIGIKLGFLESQVESLQRFADAGDRYTRHDGNLIEDKLGTLTRRVSVLEKWTREAPPKIYREMVNATLIGLKEQIKSLQKNMLQLTIEVRTNNAELKRRSPGN